MTKNVVGIYKILAKSLIKYVYSIKTLKDHSVLRVTVVVMCTIFQPFSFEENLLLGCRSF
jgi:hypothetical protein